MSQTIEQIDADILSAFNSMEEGVEYVLNRYWLGEANRIQKEEGWKPIVKQQVSFSRRGNELLRNGSYVFDFSEQHNIIYAFSRHADVGVALSFIFILALQHNGIVKS